MNTLIPAVLLLMQLAGGDFIHPVQTGDSLTSVGARFGVDVHVLAEANGLKALDKLTPGQILRINNRHIVPPSQNVSIVVNVAQRMLFYFPPEHPPVAYPIAAGRPSWKTALGDFEIMTMEEDPTWDVPVSIQEEMRRAGKPVLTHVPPSPENPLGQFWMGLSLPGIGIHGTNAPSSIYGLVTHGCIRLHPDDIRALFFSAVNEGTRGRIIYEPVLMAQVNGTVFLEVHPDAYKRAPLTLTRILDIARTGGFLDMLDLALVKEEIQKRDGVARDVTRR